jgi:hypothetical protein
MAPTARGNKALPDVNRGSLRFWGQWFGRTYDNVHTIVKCEASGQILRLFFDEGETLSITLPKGISVKNSLFNIKNATSVKWEWFSYGLPKVASNLRFLEFQNKGLHIDVTSDRDSYQLNLTAKLRYPAVEILWSLAISVA